MTKPLLWNFHNPVRIHFGAGSFGQLHSLVGGRRSLLITTVGFTRRGLTARVREMLGSDLAAVLDNVLPNPDLSLIERSIANLAGQRFECIVALGGGSAMDTAKALSLCLPAQESFSLRDHLERATPPPVTRPLAIIAIPTTAGTGSEVTPFGTIWDMACGLKYSVATPKLFPEIALLDPELTVDLPWTTTLCTGLDALSQGLESVWNRNANPLTTGIASQAVRLALDTLPTLRENLTDLGHRSRMLEASLLAGLAISQTRTALAHSMSYPITARLGMPHGLACSFMLPELLEFNQAADDGRLRLLAEVLGFKETGQLIDRLGDLLHSLGASAALRRHVRDFQQIGPLVSEMLTPGRADNNLRAATTEDVARILKRACARCLPAIDAD